MVEALLEQAAWLTPTSLFLLLNVVIGTILLSSAFTNHHKKPHHDDGEEDVSSATPPPPNPRQFVRAPSLFSRVTSFNFSNNQYTDDHQQHHPQLNHTQSSPSLLSRVTSFRLSGQANEPDVTLGENDATQSCPVTPTAPTGGVGVKRTMTRAPSFLSRVASFPLGMRNYSHTEVGEVNAHPNNNEAEKVKKSKTKIKKKGAENEMTTIKRNEAEVDAKADAFINKFKQQLKLQRIDSLMRYRTKTTTA